MSDGRVPSGQQLARLMDVPGLVQIVPRLAPEVLHRLIRHAGLERSMDLVEAASSEQLTAVLDLDLWGAPRGGRDEQFDVERLGEWIESLVERDVATAARIVARVDVALVVAGLSRYVRVLDPGVLQPTASSDDEPHESGLFAPAGLSAEIGGYIVQARRKDAWDAIVSLLVGLSAEHGECFHALMRGCRRLSDAGRELDGLDDLLEQPEQHLHEVSVGRDDRLSRRGFTSAAEARAFLSMARQPRSPGSRSLRERHPEIGLARGQELAFLANALVAGCGLQSRSFAPQEALDAAVATCGLGLLRQPVVAGVNSLVSHDLIAAFEDGWAALHREVSLFVADGLLAVLRGVSVGHSDTLDGLHALRRSLETHLAAGTPWLAQEALDVLSTLDTPAWHGLLGLLSECPVVPATVTAIVERRTGRIDPKAFAFISTDAQIEAVRAFVARLPQLLAG